MQGVLSVSTVEAPIRERPLSEAARRITSTQNGKSTHPATVTRWIKRGVRLSDGSVLKLAARRYPGGWTVSDDAVNQFIDRLTADRCGSPVASRVPNERVEAALDAAGF
jgi:hypothetical protein